MIEYRTDIEDLRASDLDGFFAGWPSHPDPETHLRVLENSDVAAIARTSTRDESSGSRTPFPTAY